MAKLHNYNGRYCETEYENAFLSFLEEAGWNYLPGSSLPRTSMRDVLYIDDMEYFLNKTNPDLTADEIQQIMDTVRLAGAESDFATLHKVYGWMVNGIQFTPQSGLPIMVNLIDFENPEKNVFRAVNQFIMSKGKGKEANYIYLSSNDVILPQKVTAAKTTHDDKQLERLMETIKTDEY